MANIYNTSSLMRKKQEEAESVLPHQERVNIEMFRAMELLGRKLERVEDERDRLARRLALIESAATLDEKTGKFYLPVVVDRDLPPPTAAAPRWMVGASVMSTAIAVLSLCVVLFHETAPALSPQQLAALNAITTPRFTEFEDKSWKSATEEADAAAKTAAPADNVVAAPSPPPPPVAAASVVPPAPAPEIAAAAPPPPVEKTPAPAVAEAKPVVKEAPPAKVAAAAPVPLTPQPPKEAAKPAPATDNEIAGAIAPDTSLPEKLALLEKHAFAGMPEAQHDLATLYASGKLVGQDYKRAAYWFSKAAEGGVANADYNLGVLFQQGLGVKKDVNKALGWYQKAAELGHPEAMYNLGIAYIEGIGTDRDVDKGVSYFKSAANAGVSQAAYNLGVLYESNFIGKIDLDKALEWYQVAANAGHTEALAAVDRLKTQTAAKADDQSLTVADLVEPASGETGEGDASPADEIKKPVSTGGGLVAKIQAVLIRQGLLPPPATGKLDAPTQDAIRAWQTKTGAPVDGKPSQAVLDGLAASSPSK